LFFTLIWGPLAAGIAPANVVALVPTKDLETLVTALQAVSRISPFTLYQEIMVVILDPSTRFLGPVYLYINQLQGAVLGAPLPLNQSLLIAWPQIVSLVASTIVLFVIGYVIFQRQEVRA
jgi:ABC-2 type transport system permease protein